MALVPPSPVGGDLEEDPVERSAGRPDPWYEAYQAYMSPELRREYLRTPDEERFEQFSLRFLDFQLREVLLREHQDDLTRDEQDLYRRLRSADECRAFVAARGRARPPVPAPSGPAPGDATPRAPAPAAPGETAPVGTSGR